MEYGHRWSGLLVTLLALLAFSCPLAAAAETPFQADNYTTQLHAADSLFASGVYKDAEKEYKKALKLRPKSLEALRGLANVKLAREDWGGVKKWSQKILKIEPADLGARYNLGRAFRETGKYKALFLRSNDFRKAKQYLDAIIADTPMFKDAILQRALVDRYEEKWFDAIRRGHEQIELKPEFENGQTSLFGFYRLFLVNVPEDTAFEWLKSQQGAWPILFTGEYFRKKEKYAQADSTYQTLLVNWRELSSVPVFLSLVRLNVAQGKAEKADAYYQQAVEAIQTNADAAFVFEDLKYLLTDRELERYAASSAPDARKEFFAKFWRKRELVPASPVRFRLIEHYRRLVKAEKDYWYDGVRAWTNSPDKAGYLRFPDAYYLNHEFNDKGLIYIRHGAPDDFAVTLGETQNSNESWLYHKREDRRKLIFHFMIAEFATGHNWRLTPTLGNQSLLADRLGWDHSISRVYYANSQIELNANLIQMAEESSDLVHEAMTTDYHSWASDIEALDVPYYLATFRGRKGKTRLEVYFGIPLDELAENHVSEEVVVEYGIAIIDQDFNEKGKLYHTEIVRPLHADAKFLIKKYQFELDPDTYNLSFYVRVDTLSRLGGENFETEVPAYDGGTLSLSDLLLAKKLATGESVGDFNRGEFEIVPNLERRFAPSDPVHLYYEIYNLKRGETGATSFEIESEIILIKKKEGGIKKVFGFLGGGGSKKSVSLKDERISQDEFSAEQVSFDVSKLAEGEYELRLKVTDRVANQTAEKSVVLKLERE